MRTLLFCLFFIIQALSSSAQLTMEFPSKDGLLMTADWYPVSSDSEIVLLCHQNRFSRGEYAETALRLNKLGYNCMAIDQRVGNEVNGIRNETAFRAREKKMDPKMHEAEQDILAAIDYLNEKYKKRIILLGSSYSASLALKIAAENNKVSSVIVFSPGEYFDDISFMRSHISALMKPLLITSSRSEADRVTDLLKDVNSRIKVQFIPSFEGEHGVKALWSSSPGNQDYWAVLISFLNKLKRTF